MNLLLGFRQSLFEKGKIVWENGIKTVYDIYTTDLKTRTG